MICHKTSRRIIRRGIIGINPAPDSMALPESGEPFWDAGRAPLALKLWRKG